MAIVNKPAGVVVYRAEGGRGGGARGGHGRDTLLSALPHVLTPSNFSVDSEEGPHTVPLDRPQPVHRLDRPTSGLMVVAKTKAAAVHLAQQFEFRKARKTYCAIVNGVPIACDNEMSSSDWNMIDRDLDGKPAITYWRQIRVVQSLHGRDGQLTLVELKPKTGRYHQLRRHLVRIRFHCCRRFEFF
jgi:23S rRNA-/tRNA-specific pseudouridylate synthase